MGKQQAILAAMDILLTGICFGGSMLIYTMIQNRGAMGSTVSQVIGSPSRVTNVPAYKVVTS